MDMNAEERRDVFEEMFRQRKQIFIDQKKWDIPSVNGEFERDEFDRDDAVYLCSMLPDGTLAGSIRFLNTSTEHMATTVFQHMFPGLVIRSPTIWEATRFAVSEDRRLQPNGVSRAACEIIAGMCAFALDHGVTQMVAITRSCWRGSSIAAVCGMSCSDATEARPMARFSSASATCRPSSRPRSMRRRGSPPTTPSPKRRNRPAPDRAARLRPSRAARSPASQRPDRAATRAKRFTLKIMRSSRGA